jgi:hypothetical protein
LAGGAAIEWPETRSLARDAGFSAMDIVIPQVEGFAAANVKEQLAQADVRIGGVPLPVEFRTDEESFERDLGLLSARARFAAQIGATTMCRALPASNDMPRATLMPLLRLGSLRDVSTVGAHLAFIFRAR